MKIAPSFGLPFAVLLSAAASAACSSSDSAPVTPTVTPDAGPPAPTGTLQVTVADGALSLNRTVSPLAGASVAFYPPGGGDMVEVMTGADGVASFSGIDWTQGKGTVVTYKTGYGASVGTNVDPDAIAALDPYWNIGGLVTAIAPVPDTSATYTLMGAIANKSDPTHYVLASTTVSGSNSTSSNTASYELTVPKDKTFSIVAAEFVQATPPGLFTFFKWIRVDVPANATTQALDFAAAPALTTKTVTRTLVLPGGASGALGGASGNLDVSIAETSAVFGVATTASAAADGGSVNLSAEFVTGGPEPVVTYNYLTKGDGSLSYVTEDGAPDDGTTVDGFIPPPAVTATSVKLSDPITGSGTVDGEELIVQYDDATTNFALLTLGSITKYPAGAAVTFTPPTYPAAIQQLLSGHTVNAYVAGVFYAGAADSLPISGVRKHFAISRPIAVTLQ